jgi:hypothetical protein
VAGARGIAEAAVWPGSANPHVPPLGDQSGDGRRRPTADAAHPESFVTRGDVNRVHQRSRAEAAQTGLIAQVPCRSERWWVFVDGALVAFAFGVESLGGLLGAAVLAGGHGQAAFG